MATDCEPIGHRADERRSRLERQQARERVTFRTPPTQLDRLDRLVDAGAYPNRSAAVRDAVAQLLESELDTGGEQ